MYGQRCRSVGSRWLRERRTFGVFQTWCTFEDDFKYTRPVVGALEEKVNVGSHAPSVASGGEGKACVWTTPCAPRQLQLD